MTQIHFNMPPELAALGAAEGITGTNRMCQVCVLYAKGDQLDATAAIWGPLVGDGRDNVQKFIEWPSSLKERIREAVIVAVSELPELPMVPVCWDHMATARPEPPKEELPKLPGYAGLPAGLNGKPRR
jgi:hypothetical protein